MRKGKGDEFVSVHMPISVKIIEFLVFFDTLRSQVHVASILLHSLLLLGL